MNDSGTIVRILKLLNILQQRPRKSVKELASKLGCGTRTVYRYMELVQNLGYEIDKNHQNRYFIQLPWNRDDELDTEEKGLLADLLNQDAVNNPMAVSIMRKLALQKSDLPTPDQIEKLRQYQKISVFRKAMQENKAARIMQYSSLASSESRDRLVQPLQFDENFNYLTAYDLEAQAVRQFHLKRMVHVELTTTNADVKVDLNQMDLFGFSSGAWMEVTLQLDHLAHQLLVENHPDARMYIQKEGDYFIFNHKVRSWKGIGRFALGLPGHIRVINPAIFRQYLQQQSARAEY